MFSHGSSQSLASSIQTKSGRRVLVNITTLIDVVFLLLIFFMVSSTFLEQPGMKLDLPSSKNTDISQKKSYSLSIYPDGKIFFNDKEITTATLAAALQESNLTTSDMAINLLADKNVPHGEVIKVMDIARLSGFKKLIIATLPPTE